MLERNPAPSETIAKFGCVEKMVQKGIFAAQPNFAIVSEGAGKPSYLSYPAPMSARL